MLRALIAIAYPLFLFPLYLDWSRRRAESQIDKMQAAVFNSPGMEAPVPPPVVVGGALLLIGYWLLTRLLRLNWAARSLAMLIGAPLGVAIFAQREAGRG